MGLLVRFVRASDFEGREEWLKPSAVPHGATRHFRDAEGSTSLYRLETADDLPTLVAAYALGHPENLKKYDIFLVDEARLSDFTIEITPAQLPDSEVSGWHRECAELSGELLARFAFAFCAHGELARFTLSQVKQLVSHSVRASRIRVDQLSDGVRRDLTKALKQTAS
ncbi:MAG: hypothetical protein WB681_00700 [Candidatus Cybelea sp.]